MKKYIATIGKAIIMLMVLAACQDIDLAPKDALNDGQFWKNPTDYKKALNSLYNNMEPLIYPDDDSDICYRLGPSTVSNGTWSAAGSDGDWSGRYSDLRDCNKIIEKSESYEGDATEIEQYVAEARFFRAYSHWRLMKKFTNLPILTKVLTTQSPELYATRNPQKEVEDFILSELEAAAAKLPKESQLAAADVGRVTQGAALALKARVALFAGTWAKNHKHRSDYVALLDQAIDAANRVIESNEYSLYEGSGAESYRKLFIDDGDESSETILANRYALNIRTHATGNSVYWGWRGNPTKKLAEMYLCKSTGLPIEKAGSGFQGYDRIADEFKNRDPRMTQTMIIPGTAFTGPEGSFVCDPDFSVRPASLTGYKLWKYMAEIQAGSGQSTFDTPILRYAEVLLVLAEATFERDEAISDEVLDKTINTVRSRKGVEMPALSNSFATTNGLDMRTEIRRERTVELAFEGFRRDDLRRWKTAEVELAQPLKGIKYKGTEYEEKDVLNDGNPGLVDANGFLIVEEAANRFFVAPKHYFYPVPLDEIMLNPNLAPNNSGW